MKKLLLLSLAVWMVGCSNEKIPTEIKMLAGGLKDVKIHSKKDSYGQTWYEIGGTIDCK